MNEYWVGGAFAVLAGVAVIILLRKTADYRARLTNLESSFAGIRNETREAVAAGKAATRNTKIVAEAALSAIKHFRSLLNDSTVRQQAIADQVVQCEARIANLLSLVAQFQNKSGNDVDINVPTTSPLTLLAEQIAHLSEAISQVERTVQDGLGQADGKIELISSRAAATENDLGNLRTTVEESNRQLEQLAIQIGTLNKEVDTINRSSASAREITTVATVEPPEAPSAPSLVPQVDPIDGTHGHTTPFPNGSDPETITKVDPGSRGGRPREQDENAEVKIRQRSTQPKPSLVARRDYNGWQIFLELSPIDDNSLCVDQVNIGQLPQAEENTFGPLKDLQNTIHINQATDTAIEFTPLQHNSSYLLFHLYEDTARRAAHYSSGQYLAIVPDSWSLSAQCTASFVDPEPCGIAGYTAHYLSSARSSTVVFDRPGSTSLHLQAPRGLFRLEGTIVRDHDNKMGPLFVGDCPTLRFENGAAPTVRTVVIGEEGPGKDKWRLQHDLKIDATDRWQLPEQIKTQNKGWYFVRLYDHEGDLIESFDFRYLEKLRSIEQTQDDSLGRETIRYVHSEGVTVTADRDMNWLV